MGKKNKRKGKRRRSGGPKPTGGAPPVPPVGRPLIPPPVLPSTLPLPSSLSPASLTSRVFRLLKGIIVVIGLFFSYVEFLHPRVSVTPNSMLDPAAPLSMQFTIANGGYFSFYDTSYRCAIKRIEGESGWEIGELSMVKDDGRVGILTPDAPATVSCKFVLDAFHVQSPIAKADIAVWVFFRPKFFPIAVNRMFRFVTDKTADGRLAWFPQPLWEEDK